MNMPRLLAWFVMLCATAAYGAQLGPKFQVRRMPPFLITGDDNPDTFNRHVDGIIAWAYRHLKAAYFADSELARPLVIYLFRDKQSYESNHQMLWGELPDTPFGYYSSARNALVMNIGTGGGTLVHEMVHPMLAADFPGVPSWFNEGLASLYEQCGEENGTIHGYPNWRLPALQQSLVRPTPRLATLMATTTREFYGRRAGLNYAEARYLLYWLQELGLLRAYYLAFRANAAADPTGAATLLSLFPGRSLDDVELAWQEFTRALRFR